MEKKKTNGSVEKQSHATHQADREQRNRCMRKLPQVESGVSREDICEALVQIKDGYIPTDPLALRVLTLEMENWPFLNDVS